MQHVTSVVAVLLMILMIIFGVQNHESVDVRFLMWAFSTPKIFLILGSFLFGMVSGWGLLELIKRLF
jgi:uncharacterized integral membrane protein